MRKIDTPAKSSLLPQNIEAEESIISAILLDNDVLPDVTEILTAEDFYTSAHKKIFTAIVELFSEDEPVDLVTLANKLKEKGVLEKVGGATYLAKIVDSAPIAINARHYAGIVNNKALLRRLIYASNKILNRCYEDSGDIDAVTDYVERSIFDELSMKNKSKAGYLRIDSIIEKNFVAIAERQKNKSLYTGIPTGFDRLDSLTSGLQASDLIILAARPAMGKTAFALNIARNVAVDAKVPVLVCSLEMSKEQLGMRLLCAEARVSSSRIRSGFVSKDDWAKLAHASGVLAGAPIFIDDTSSITALDIRSKARRLKIKEDIGLIIVDYLQLMEGRGGDKKSSDRRDLEIADISRTLKGLAKELDIPIIALSQLNRMLEQRNDKKPKLSDLRESGAIEQDADIVMFIYREEQYKEKPEESIQGIADILLSKHRNGETGVAKLAFLSEYTRFENLSYE